jgi:RND family efflux transporter MFP subunit
LIPFAALLAIAGCNRVENQMPPPKPPAVEVSYPIMREVTDYEDVTGRTDAIPTVEVRPHVTGYLKDVFFKDGDMVKKGDELFEIDPRTFRAELDKAKASVEQMTARVTRLMRDYDRELTLYERKANSQKDFDLVRGDLGEAKAGLKSAEAAVERAAVDLSYTKITAEFTGRLSRRNVDPGNLVKADDTILTTIVGMDPMYVYFDIDERTLLRFLRLIREKKVDDPRTKALPVLLGLADEEGFPHAGKINFVDNKLDVATGTLRLRGEFPNPQPHILAPGLFVRVRIQVGTPHQAILIAERALGTDQGQKFLYVVDDKDVAQYRTVKVGFLHEIKVGDKTYPFREIVSGLSDGEKIVVSGMQRVRPGNPVDAKLREMPLPGTGK